MDMQSIGENIRFWREERGIKLNELARLAGVDRGNLSKMESGSAGASIETLQKLAAALKVPLAYFVKEDTNVAEVQEGSRRIRLLDWSQVGSWRGKLPPDRGEAMQEYVLLNVVASSETFALTVKGDAMKPDFRQGDVIVVDPLRLPRPGSFVVAKDAEGNGTFKQYRDLGLDNEGKQVFELRPMNNLYPPRRSDREGLEVVGTVVQYTRDLP